MPRRRLMADGGSNPNTHSANLEADRQETRERVTADLGITREEIEELREIDPARRHDELIERGYYGYVDEETGYGLATDENGIPIMRPDGTVELDVDALESPADLVETDPLIALIGNSAKAKVLLAMLNSRPRNATDICRAAGISTSSWYATVRDELLASGLLVEVAESGTSTLYAIDDDDPRYEALQTLRRQSSKAFAENGWDIVRKEFLDRDRDDSA
ncbi:hypothetical protein [Halosolutus halophilus]|uniref:hypothetical protein n=1 Tax=Halosolutus halophilus TaxID=1552990 RepID=UPI0022350735|nr:hypothetical protein [Halosolutus halophilus]